MIRARDLAERVFWSFVSGFLGSLLATPVMLDVIENVAKVEIDVTTMGAVVISAAFAGFTAAANAVLVVARWRLSVLPDPGEGLPGLPTDGGSVIEGVLLYLLGLFGCVVVIAGATKLILFPAGLAFAAAVGLHLYPATHPHRTR